MIWENWTVTLRAVKLAFESSLINTNAKPLSAHRCGFIEVQQVIGASLGG